MERVVFDYSKLKGRIVEKCGSQRAFANKLNITEATMTAKLMGNTYFSQSEILKSIKILDIEPGTVSEYFFAARV